MKGSKKGELPETEAALDEGSFRQAVRRLLDTPPQHRPAKKAAGKKPPQKRKKAAR